MKNQKQMEVLFIMGKSLILAEKPSVGKDLARVLG